MKCLLDSMKYDMQVGMGGVNVHQFTKRRTSFDIVTATIKDLII